MLIIFGVISIFISICHLYDYFQRRMLSKCMMHMKNRFLELLYFNLLLRYIIDSFLEIHLIFIEESIRFHETKAKNVLFSFGVIFYFFYILTIIYILIRSIWRSKLMTHTSKFYPLINGLPKTEKFKLVLFYFHYFLIWIILSLFVALSS